MKNYWLKNKKSWQTLIYKTLLYLDKFYAYSHTLAAIAHEIDCSKQRTLQILDWLARYQLVQGNYDNWRIAGAGREVMR